MVIFDEAGFMDENAIVAVEPYTMGDTSFKTSIDENFDIRTLPSNKPNQRLYISSASDKTSYFYKKFYDFSLRMLAGDNRYFTASITADIPLSPTLRGKKYSPLLSQAEIDSVMNQNPSKGMREFYNKFDEDSDDQIIKSHVIDRNSTFTMPELTHDKGYKYILAYDPASIADNSHLLVMKICHDEKRGYYGKIVNSVVFKDLAYKVGNKQMLYQDQVHEIRNYLVIYNGNNPEYQNIHSFEIDTGMGGAGIIHTHSYLLDWKDQYGDIHRGVIDRKYYDEVKQREFPNAYNVLNMVEPTKNKNMIIERLIELMELGLIEFPQEYNNSGTVDVEDENGDIVRKNLTKEEALALMSIDIMKEECKNIHRYKNTSSGRITYKLRPEMERKMNDDRFYTLALAASALYELRESEELSKNKTKKSKDRTVLKLFN